MIGPCARGDLRDGVHAQVCGTLERGARVVCWGWARQSSGRDFSNERTVVSDVRPGMPMFDEEVFAAGAAVVRAADADEAISLANESNYGLGFSLWTRDASAAEEFAARVEAGAVFVNGMVASELRLPFGGVKKAATDANSRRSASTSSPTSKRSSSDHSTRLPTGRHQRMGGDALASMAARGAPELASEAGRLRRRRRRTDAGCGFHCGTRRSARLDFSNLGPRVFRRLRFDAGAVRRRVVRRTSRARHRRRSRVNAGGRSMVDRPRIYRLPPTPKSKMRHRSAPHERCGFEETWSA